MSEPVAWLRESARVNIEADLEKRRGSVRSVVVEAQKFWERVLPKSVVKDIIAEALSVLHLTEDASDETPPDRAVEHQVIEGHA